MTDTRPKCKVVLKDGERGARIFPKGCQVRNRVVDGVKRKVDKRGEIKPLKKKVKVISDSFSVNVKTVNGGYVKLMYDTGATDTTVNLATAHKLGLVTRAKGPAKPAPKYEGKTEIITAITADSSRVDVMRFKNIPLTIRETGRSTTGNVDIMPRGLNLYGVPHMRGQRKFLSVNFN
jgi:hypothetical protein